MLVGIYSPKGGSGTSVLAAACAIVSSQETPTTLVDCSGDLPAILGLAQCTRAGVKELLTSEDAPIGALDRIAVQVMKNLDLLIAGVCEVPETTTAGEKLGASLRSRRATTVIDLGVPSNAGVLALARNVDVLIMVVRPCYLAYRRASENVLTPISTGAVIVEEANRALTARDLERVIGIPILATVAARPSIARAVDAGILAARLPDALARPARSVLAAARSKAHKAVA